MRPKSVPIKAVVTKQVEVLLCARCGQELKNAPAHPESGLFYLDGHNWDGQGGTCIACKAEIERAEYEAQQARRLEQAKKRDSAFLKSDRFKRACPNLWRLMNKE